MPSNAAMILAFPAVVRALSYQKSAPASPSVGHRVSAALPSRDVDDPGWLRPFGGELLPDSHFIRNHYVSLSPPGKHFVSVVGLDRQLWVIAFQNCLSSACLLRKAATIEDKCNINLTIFQTIPFIFFNS